MRLAAIDFETADEGADSACAIGIAIVENGRLLKVKHHLIRPPRKEFVFTYIHGITWDDVKNKPVFRDVWKDIRVDLENVDYFLAHNAGFDRKVLYTCCAVADYAEPATPFVCTVKLARSAWGIRPTTLPDVCGHLQISLDHHKADSDAKACAQIAIAALKKNHPLESGILGPPTVNYRKRIAEWGRLEKEKAAAPRYNEEAREVLTSSGLAPPKLTSKTKRWPLVLGALLVLLLLLSLL